MGSREGGQAPQQPWPWVGGSCEDALQLPELPVAHSSTLLLPRPVGCPPLPVSLPHPHWCPQNHLHKHHLPHVPDSPCFWDPPEAFSSSVKGVMELPVRRAAVGFLPAAGTVVEHV